MLKVIVGCLFAFLVLDLMTDPLRAQQAKTVEDVKPKPEPAKVDDTPAINDDQMQLYQDECDVRRKRGLAVRILDAGLCALAQRRAWQISRRFGHYDVPLGSSEIIAYNNNGTSQAIRQWVGSPGHAKSMFGRRMIGGYGVHRTGGKVYCVALYRDTSVDKPVKVEDSTVTTKPTTTSPCANGQCNQSTRSSTVRGPLGIFRWRRR